MYESTPYEDGYWDAMSHAVNELRYRKDYLYADGVDEAEDYLDEKYRYEAEHWFYAA